MENRRDFSGRWRFLKTSLRTTYAEAESALTRFQPVELPHDWLIYDTAHLYEDGCGWYRKEFTLETGEIDDLGRTLFAREAGSDETKVFARTARGEKVFLIFDGVYMDSTIYVNGTLLTDWKYGYSAFEADLTPALKQGRNVIMVQVRHKSPNSRWYSGAGIFRKVEMKVCPAAYLAANGTYVHLEKQGENFRMELETEVLGRLDESLRLEYALLDADGKRLSLGDAKILETSKGEGRGSCVTTIKSPHLWDIEAPYCYTLLVELHRAGRAFAIDQEEITVGFRTAEFTCDRGFLLNGRQVKLHGVCEHHDLGCLGAAFHLPAMERKLSVLRSMGVNAIRTSHNMPAKELLALADREGFLVLDEAFDMWEISKTEFDYARFFPEWHERDVRSWIRRDRNHPSVILWSIGNEISDTNDEHGAEITRELVQCVRLHDPKENAPITIGSNYMQNEPARKCADIVKVAGYNYAERFYAAHHAEHPDWKMYGSETASIVQSRGVYKFPLEQTLLADEDEQCSALGNSNTSWGARSWEACIVPDRDANFIAGQFLWSGFDYIGEPTPYQTKNSYFGQIDTAGFPKDAYFVYQAAWTDARKNPMVHLFPYWDFNPGQVIDVRACTNLSSVELFVNGVSKGRQEIDMQHGKKLLADWKVPYAPGEITAVAYDEDGNEAARETRHSFGESAKIKLSVDKRELAADGEDLCFVTVETLDANGYPVENAADYVTAKISGPGRILGMDNGDSTDYDAYKTNVRKLFSGKLLIVIGSIEEAGEIELTVSGEGLESASLRLQAKNPTSTGRFLEHACESGKAPSRIPIRKLELCAPDGLVFSKEKKALPVEATLLPQNTTDTTLVWKAVNASGIEVPFAKVETVAGSEGRRANVTVIGDGEFYVRCQALSEGRVRLISQLEASATGLGATFGNPYAAIPAALCDGTIGDIKGGNEQGITTARETESGIYFEHLDFGTFGSDELTLPIFAMSEEPYAIELWIGKPHAEGSRILTTLSYQNPCVWNVYQERTYHLPERIRSVQTIGFTMHDWMMLKSVAFTKREKAYAALSGKDADKVYGDNFRREDEKILDIGNNVTIRFEGMEFGEKGAKRVCISGRTPLAKNAIRLLFTTKEGDAQTLNLEFLGSGDDFSSQTFAVEGFVGEGTVELIFLPGSKFDFAGIQFAE